MYAYEKENSYGYPGVKMERFVLVELSTKYLVLNLEEDTVYSTASQNAQLEL